MIIVGSSQCFALSDPNVRFFNDSKAMAVHDQESAILESRKKIATTTEMFFLYTFQSFYCDEMLSNSELMKEVGRADLIIGELLYLCSSSVVAKFPSRMLSYLPLPSLHRQHSPSVCPLSPRMCPSGVFIFDRARNLWRWMSLYVLFVFVRSSTRSRQSMISHPIRTYRKLLGELI